MFTVRKASKGEYGSEPGSARFLEVPEQAKTFTPDHQIKKSDWIKKVLDESTGRFNPSTNEPMGDIVMYVHGFNNSVETTLKRHRYIKAAFEKFGFQGSVISFDWPSHDTPLNYLEDRWDAKQTANQLVKEGIASFVKLQRPECEINLHLMAHSMGTYVVREAFDDADDRRTLASFSWSISQVLLFGADISASSMAEGSSKSSSLYRHCNRLTNYYNHFDSALKLSNIKRVGVAPRVGRVGLPQDVPRKAVDVNCTSRFESVKAVFGDDEFAGHRFYFEDETFLRDAYLTILGDTDRSSIATRSVENGNLILTPG
ncbi:MAG: alpha/beta hydrolase [Rhodobacteraceae bacterium]|nr:alpha/beta hydrolase [Paracoccaceae bacterium]